jgi:hypothetical protein
MLERQLAGEDPRVTEFPEAHGNMFKSLRLELKKIINNPIGITKQLVAAMVSKNADFPILDKKA